MTAATRSSTTAASAPGSADANAPGSKATVGTPLAVGVGGSDGEGLALAVGVVAIDQNAQVAQNLRGLVNLSDARFKIVVIRIRRVEKVHAILFQRANRRDDVVGADRDVLDAGTTVKLEVLLDLGFLFALRRLVDRKLHAVLGIGHHFGAQRGIFGRDVFVVERHELREAEDAGVEISPGVHLAPADVAHTVIDCEQVRVAHVQQRFALGDKRGHERSTIILALDKTVNGISVRRNRGPYNAAVRIAQLRRL